MTGFDGLTKTQKIRATLHRDVRSICKETCHFLGLEITKAAMEVIAELVYKKIAIYGSDLEAFAKHAKRTTINSEDVKLLVRRIPSLKTHLNAIAPAPGSVAKEKRRKTVVLPTARQETPAKPTDETPVTKPIEETPSKTKNDTETNDEKQDPKKPLDFENMIIDDTIDLTFD